MQDKLKTKEHDGTKLGYEKFPSRATCKGFNPSNRIRSVGKLFLHMFHNQIVDPKHNLHSPLNKIIESCLWNRKLILKIL